VKSTNSLAPWWAASAHALEARKRDDVEEFLSGVGVCATLLAEESEALGALDPAALAALLERHRELQRELIQARDQTARELGELRRARGRVRGGPAPTPAPRLTSERA